MDEHIAKPIVPAELLTKVTAWITRREIDISSAASLGGGCSTN
jgi:hypothetical protein